MKNLHKHLLKLIAIPLCAVFLLLAQNARAQLYFHPTGTGPDYGISPNGTYTWEGLTWDATSTGSGTLVAWWGTNDAHFNSTSTPYTVTVNTSNNISGIFGLTGVTLTINDAGSGTGLLNWQVNNDQGLDTGGGTLTIGVAMTGISRVCPETSAGTLKLFGNNTYSGNTYYGYGYPLTYFNNNNSFGVGAIQMGASSTIVGLLGTGGATITLANNIQHTATSTTGTGSGYNWAADPNTPVVLTGTYNLGTANAKRVIQSSGGPTSPLTIHGVINGSVSILYLQANNSSAIYLDGANTYAGQTVLRSGPNGGGITVSVGGNPANLAFNMVSGGSAASNLGHPTTAANGTIAMGDASTCTLIYTGAGETTDRIINLAGTTGGATLQADGTGALVFTSAFTASGAGSKTLTLQGSNTGLNTIGGAVVDNSAANKTSVVKAQAGTWVLGGVNTYTGGTTVNGGTLAVSGSIAGSVTVSGGVLQLDSPTTLASGAIVTLPASPANGMVNLNFTGTQNINLLNYGGTSQPAGTYGSPTSGADHTSSIYSGNGKLLVNGAPFIVTQPQSQAVWPDGTATFSVVALGAPTYQWRRNNVDITGANASSYQINPVESANAGTYTCYLLNGSGNTTSAGAVLTVLGTNAYTQIVRGDSPIAYWRLDETGTTAYDAVGNNNGTYNNAILGQTPGYSVLDSDACVTLQKMPLGQGSFVSVPSWYNFNFFTNTTPTFTFEAWAYFTNITGVARLFSTDQSPVPGGYMMGITGPNGLVFTTSGAHDYAITLTSPLQLNTWYHIAFGFDGSTFHYYVNGTPVGTLVKGQYGTDNGGTCGAPLCLGANGDFLSSGGGTHDNSEQLQGNMDEAAVYGAFLGDAEILAHYSAAQPAVPRGATPTADFPTNYVSLTTTLTEQANGTVLHYQWYKNGAPVGTDSSTYTLSNLQLSDATTYTVNVNNGAGGQTNPPGVVVTVLPIPTSVSQMPASLQNNLVLHLPFDADYKDISGRQNNGTNVGATLNTTGAAIGGGYLTYSSTAGGPYNYVTLGKPSDLVFGAAGNFSVAFWVRQSALNNTNLPFIGNATNSTARTSPGWSLAPGLTSLGAGNGAWAWAMEDSSLLGFGAMGDPGSISDGNWHHLAFVFDRSSVASTYLDGVLKDQRNDSYFGAVDSGGAVNIGQDPTGAFSASDGADIDDLGIWRRALTQLEISAAYLAGTQNSPGVPFAPALSGASSVTIGSIVNNGNGTVTISYSGGGGSTFTLVKSANLSTTRDAWTTVQSSSSTPGSFTFTPTGDSFYSIQSK
jgi:autotransporter-associated beta strand protein